MWDVFLWKYFRFNFFQCSKSCIKKNKLTYADLKKNFQWVLPAVWETYVCPQFFILCGKIKTIWSPFYCYTCQNVLGCRHQLSISWGTCACCSPELALRGRGHCITVLDFIPGFSEVMLSVTLTASMTSEEPCHAGCEGHGKEILLMT